MVDSFDRAASVGAAGDDAEADTRPTANVNGWDRKGVPTRCLLGKIWVFVKRLLGATFLVVKRRCEQTAFSDESLCDVKPRGADIVMYSMLF